LEVIHFIALDNWHSSNVLSATPLRSMDVPIPPRIILMGTSKISLNERFSKLPVSPRRRPAAATVTSYRSADHDYREPEVVEYSPDLEFKNSAVADGDDLLGVRFVPRYSGVRTIHRSPRAYWQPYVPLKLRNRIKFPLPRNYVAFPPSRAYIRRSTFNGSRSLGLARPVRSLRFKQEGFSTALKGGRFNNRGTARGLSVARGRDGVGFAFRRRQQISREQLDRELDAYMKRSKHPKIDVSDLVEG
uniref:Chromatin target of PRMT1 protein C-terminal domain-containing protein n=1 Tax=Parascaris univalens TaxID=6257 RepID=A0A915C046_PARUN